MVSCLSEEIVFMNSSGIPDLSLALSPKKKNEKKDICRRRIMSSESPFKSLNPFLYEVQSTAKELEQFDEYPDRPKKTSHGEGDYEFYDASPKTRADIKEDFEKAYQRVESHATEINPQLIQTGLNPVHGANPLPINKEGGIEISEEMVGEMLGFDKELFKDIVATVASFLVIAGLSTSLYTIPFSMVLVAASGLWCAKTDSINNLIDSVCTDTYAEKLKGRIGFLNNDMTKLLAMVIVRSLLPGSSGVLSNYIQGILMIRMQTFTHSEGVEKKLTQIAGDKKDYLDIVVRGAGTTLALLNQIGGAVTSIRLYSHLSTAVTLLPLIGMGFQQKVNLKGVGGLLPQIPRPIQDSEEINTIIGLNIERYRERVGMTRAMLAEAVNLSEEDIERIETTGEGVKVDIVVNIANVLGVEFIHLFPDEVKK